MPEPPEPTTDRSRYPGHPRRVANARRRAERVLVCWGVEREAVEDVCGVVSELVTNAVVHARTPRGREVGVTLMLLGHVVRVEVRDADPTLLRPISELADGTSLPGRGRGLLVVDRLCGGRWGSVAEVIGKTVWAEIPCEGAAVREAPATQSPARDARLGQPAEGLVNFSSKALAFAACRPFFVRGCRRRPGRSARRALYLRFLVADRGQRAVGVGGVR
ncbi:ATP-binding protein [Streptomyces sp. NPDC006476]|uniref:ATP-binding protein n=1 Tax=Streptomyces sp. NPDC006476 TaxID=3157175 RepID=UPI0033B48A21